MLNLILMKRNAILVLCLAFIIAIISGCTAYPACPDHAECILISEDETIHIPVFLPLTSAFTAITDEQAAAINFAYVEVFDNNPNYAIEIIDNYDSAKKNQELQLSFAENPVSPIQLSSLSGFTEDLTQNLPSLSELLIQAMPALSALADQSQQAILLTNYAHLPLFQTTSFCLNNTTHCLAYDSLLYDEQAKTAYQTADLVIYAAPYETLLIWIDAQPAAANIESILLDTELSQPKFIPNCQRCRYLLPAAWFTSIPELSEDNTLPDWQYLSSYQNFQTASQIFENLLENTKETKNGFRLINQNLFEEPAQAVIEFKLYMFNESSFIANQP